MQSPTQRSLLLLRKEGCFAQVVERFNPYAKVRVDLFGFIDIVAIDPEKKELVGVQTTSGSNLTDRIKKAVQRKELRPWLETGGRLEFHGWRKIGPRGKRKLWKCDRRIFTVADL